MRPPAFGMHPALGNDLAIKVCELLDQPDILEQSRTTTTGCQIFVLSGTGAPVALVKCSGFDIMNSQFSEVLLLQVVYES